MNPNHWLVAVAFKPLGRRVYVLNFGDDREYAREALDALLATEPAAREMGNWAVVRAPKSPSAQLLAHQDIECVQSLGYSRFFRSFAWFPPREGFYSDLDNFQWCYREFESLAIMGYMLDRIADRLVGIDPDVETPDDLEQKVPQEPPDPVASAPPFGSDEHRQLAVVDMHADDTHDDGLTLDELELLRFLNRSPTMYLNRLQITDLVADDRNYKGLTGRDAIRTSTDSLLKRGYLIAHRQARKGVRISPKGVAAVDGGSKARPGTTPS